MSTWTTAIVLIWTVHCSHLVYSQPPSCRAGWKQLGASCYLLDDFTSHWAEAQSICHAFHAKLVEIESLEENKFVVDMIVKKWPSGFHKNLAVWTGATDMETKGIWRWADSDALLEVTDWGAGQPANNNEHCMAYQDVLGGVAYRWHDYPCNFNNYFVCEQELKNTSPIIG